MIEKKHPVFVTFCIIFGAVLCVFVLKGFLLISRYGITASGRQCEQSENGHNNQTVAVKAKVSHEYIFTTIVYAILSVMRILEYLFLAIQFYTFLFRQNEIDYDILFKKHSKRFLYLPLFSIILLPYFFLGVVIPALGIYQEIELAERLAICYRHYHEIYITYSVINFLRYMSAYTVRVMMIFIGLSLNKIWFSDHAGPPKHTSMGLAKITRGNGDSSVIAGQVVAASTGLSHDHREMNDDSVQSLVKNCNNPALQKVLDDWKVVSIDYQTRVKGYAEIGKKVQVIQELFQTWFILPWVIYFVASSLKTYNILRPWNTDGDGNTPPSDIPHIYYLLYNINQLITLIIPFLCAKKINTYHQKYYQLMRAHQLERFKDDPSCLSFARQLMVE